MSLGLPLELDWFFDKIDDRQSMERDIPPMLSRNHLPTAIFCMEDILAIGLIRCLQSHGVRVPEDVSVISIDDILISSQTFPALTTVALDKDALGRNAVDMLMQLINGEEPASITISSSDLIVRESVKRIEESL